MHRPFSHTAIKLNELFSRSVAVFTMAALCMAGSVGCADQVSRQEQLVNLPGQVWFHSFQPWVHLQIEDSTVAYRIYAVIRHTQAFKYDNLLLRYGYIAPGDSAVYQEVNLPLARNDQWLGDTLGSIIETRVRLGKAPQNLPVGDNGFVLQHMMPDEPLAGILQMGIRIEAVASSENVTPAQTSALPGSSNAQKRDSAQLRKETK